MRENPVGQVTVGRLRKSLEKYNDHQLVYFQTILLEELVPIMIEADVGKPEADEEYDSEEDDYIVLGG